MSREKNKVITHVSSYTPRIRPLALTDPTNQRKRGRRLSRSSSSAACSDGAAQAACSAVRPWRVVAETKEGASAARRNAAWMGGKHRREAEVLLNGKRVLGVGCPKV